MNITKSQLIRSAKIEYARRDAWQFCLYIDYEFFSKRKFLRVVAYLFQYLIDKSSTPEYIINFINESPLVNYNSNKPPTKSSVSMPPRSGKSYVVSCCSAWALGRYPQESVMRNTCTIKLYRKFSYDIRKIIKKELFLDVFPDVQLADDKQNVEGWNTNKSKQVGYFGSGTGGSIIGFGASLIAITDDLYKGMESALSETISEKTIEWYQGEHGSRLEKGCPELDIGTRWAKRDVIGKCEEEGQYDIIIRIPALINGETFCDDVKSTEEYLKVRDRTDSVIWEAEYMQEPIEAKGLLFPIDELNRFSLKSFDRSSSEANNSYVDIADEGDDNHCVVGSCNVGTKIYLTDVLFTKENTEINIPKTAEILNRLKPEYCRIETNMGGTMYPQLLTPLISDMITLLTIKNTSNKQTRILTISAIIKKYVYFADDYEDNSDYDKFMKNLTSYVKEGKNKHDDAPDALAGLAQFIVNYLTHLYE